MGRPRRKLRWVKFDIDRLLFGTTRDELSPAQRSVWYDLILLAGQANDDGWIIPPTYALPRILKVGKDTVKRALEKCEEHGKVKIDGNRLCVVNFAKYNPSRWESARFGDTATKPTSNVDTATKGNRVDTEESRVEEIQKRVESEEMPPSILSDYEQTFGGTINSSMAEQLRDLWEHYPALEIHEYAREEMRENVEERGGRPSVAYYAKCCQTKFGQDYEEVKEEEDASKGH